jgi:outer membrane protein assembly factor BamB
LDRVITALGIFWPVGVFFECLSLFSVCKEGPMTKRIFSVVFAIVLLTTGWQPPVQGEDGPFTVHQRYLPIVFNQYTLAPDPMVDLAWRWGDVNQAPGSAGIQVVDWDADGTNETFVAHSAMIFAIRHAGDYRFEQFWAVPNKVGWGMADFLSSSNQELWVIDSEGWIEIYRPFAFEPSSRRQVSLPSGAAVLRALGDDLFGDDRRQMLLLVRVGSELRLLAYALPSLQQLWEYSLDVPSGSYGDPIMIVAQVDTDSAREVILSYGAVIDPAQSVEQWFYNEGFGIAMQTANIDGDVAEELISLSGWDYVTAFDIDLLTPKWQIETGSDHDSLLVADVAGSAFPEILVGEGQWGNVAVYDSQTQALLWNVQNPEHGVSGIGVGYADNDGELDLIWGSGWTSSGADHLYLTPISRRQPTFTFPDYDGPYQVAPLQMDEDDALELVVFTQGTNSGYGDGMHFVLDSLTGEQETDLRLDVTSTSSYYTSWRILLGNVDTDPGQELILSTGNDLYLFDHTGARLVKRSFSTDITPRWVGDVDGDGELELVGHTSNRITVHAIATLEYEWQSVTHSPGVSDLDVGDVDGDGRMEIVFHGAQSSVKAYDGQTHLLDWQMPAAQRASGIAVGNADCAGNLEILVIEDNTLKVYDGLTRVLLHTGANLGPSYDQWDVTLVTMTFSPYPQLIVVGGGKAYVFIHTYDCEPVQTITGDVRSLATSDTDGDGHLDLLLGQTLGVMRYRAREPFPDVTPPFARPITPAPGATLVSRNAFAVTRFSEAMDGASITDANAQLRSGVASLPAALNYDTATRLLRLVPQGLMPANAQITVWLGPGLLDEAGNGLDGNLNGVGGEPGDAVTWQFQTGAGVDESGPDITGLTLTPNPAWAGMQVSIDAIVDDTHPQAASTVMGAEYFLDAPGVSGTGAPLQAVDGRFDERQEEIIANIDTTGWTADRVVYVHAVDSVDNWGEFSQVTLDIQPEAAANWPTYGQNPGHTGYNASQTGAASFVLAWERDLFSLLGVSSARPLAQVALANGVVAASVDTSDGGVMALDASNGSERWRRTFTNKHSINPPTIAYGTVYFQQGNHGSDSFLFALNILTGQEMWRSPFAAQWESYLAPTVSEGKVFVNGGYYGGMYGYDAFDGDQLWFVDLAQYDGWTPAYSQGAVYSCVGGRLAAWHPSYGTELWSLSLGSCGAVVPVIDNDVAFLIGGDGSLIAVDLITRAEKWRLMGSFLGTPAVANNVVYALDGNSLRAYDSAGGALLWSYVAGNTLVGAPVVTAADIFIASESHTWVIDRATHALVWELDKGGWLTVANNQLFVAQQDGKLAAYDIAVE